jgi:hypothetical protein
MGAHDGDKDMNYAYFKDEDFTAGTDESGMQTAAFGDLIGVTSTGDEPDTLPGSPQIGAVEEVDVYGKVPQV